MTAIRINPETLEQDGTVALPGKNLGYEKIIIVYCLHGVYFQVSRRGIETDFEITKRLLFYAFGLVH